MTRARKPKVVRGAAPTKVELEVTTHDIPIQQPPYDPQVQILTPRSHPQPPNGLDPTPPLGSNGNVQSGASQAHQTAIIVEPDPLHPTLSMVFLVAARRILSFAQSYPSEQRAEPFVRQVLARVCVQDPTVKVLVALDTNSGEVLAHLLAAIESNGVDRWAFCWQAEANASPPGLLQQMIAQATPWAKQHGATHVLMATQIDPRFWEARYGFETVRHVMRKPL